MFLFSEEKPELSTDPNNPNIATKSPISHLNEIKNGKLVSLNGMYCMKSNLLGIDGLLV